VWILTNFAFWLALRQWHYALCITLTDGITLTTFDGITLMTFDYWSMLYYCNNDIIVNMMQEYKSYRDLLTNEELDDGTVRKLKLNINLNLV